MAPLLYNPDDLGTLRHSDEEKTDILQSQFCAVFAHEPEGEIPQLEPHTGERLERLEIKNNLQNELHQMEKWSKTWFLQFHPGKCLVMSVGIWWNIIQVYPYELLATGLKHVLEDKDLGIIIDSELTFESHIEAKLGTANQMLGIIRRSFSCCTADIVIPLYKAFVSQHLEFGVAVWGGFKTIACYRESPDEGNCDCGERQGYAI